MTELEKVYQIIEEYRNEIITLQTELTSRVALGPENGGDGEYEKSEYLKELLKDLKPDYFDEIKVPDERVKCGYRPNLIARWNGRMSDPTVWVLSHMDIVPPGDLSLWKGDPYKVRVEGNVLFGRGVEDNQQGIVSSYLALKAIRDVYGTTNLPVGLVFVADEETGSGFGLDYILENHREIFKPNDLIIVPDGGNTDGTMVEVAEKSMLWLKFIVTGVQCHASTPEMGKNSLYATARIILALDKLKSAYGFKDEMFKPAASTFEPTKIEANVPNVNTIPGRDTFYFDCRILPVYEIDKVIEEIKKIVKKIEEDLELNVDIEPVYRQDAVNPTSPDAPVVEVLLKAIKKIKGLEAKPMGIGGGTVAAFFRQAGFPAAVWMTSQDNAHQPNEYCLIDNIITDTKIFSTVYMGNSND